MKKECLTIIPSAQHNRITVQLLDENDVPVSETLVLRVRAKSPCEKVAFIWLNQRGGFDSYTFNTRPEEDTKTTRSFFNKQSTDEINPERVVLSIESEKELVVYSQILNREQQEWLSGMLESPMVYLVDDSTGQRKLVPINILNKRQLTKSAGLIQFEIQYTYAHSRITQNQFKAKPLANTSANGGLTWETVWT